MRTRLLLSIAWVFFLFSVAGCSPNRLGKQAPLIPMSVFFMSEDRDVFRLSPDGEHVAYLSRWESRLKTSSMAPSVARAESSHVNRRAHSTAPSLSLFCRTSSLSTSEILAANASISP